MSCLEIRRARVTCHNDEGEKIGKAKTKKTMERERRDREEKQKTDRRQRERERGINHRPVCGKRVENLATL